ncbi:protein DNA polymerase [Southern Psittacara leucophthalmus aviadenovirus]|uniref:DNA polymerase n=1 Tax=Southern Psittacara leucophthalmus aviadenovirus TaxID=2604330 RepID=A0AAF1DB82_9ADEN|nr:protein DNA polymerase [Southern Psittacara leucophthalmus aviadenovirus]QEJ80767.1 protein DNA polymerase [Southern Psittacara leucophthalmus aviadenovirus]
MHQRGNQGQPQALPARPTGGSGRALNMPIPIGSTLLGKDSLLVQTASTREVSDYFKSFKGNHATKSAVYFVNNQPHKFIMTKFAWGMRKFLKMHKFLTSPRSRRYNIINYQFYAEDPIENLKVFRPTFIGVFTFKGKIAKVLKIATHEKPLLPPMHIAKSADGSWIWINSITPVTRCPVCADYWVVGHKCSSKRSSFYHFAVKGEGKKMWQHLHFSCPAMKPNTKLLFVTYDIETYTVFEEKGKRMQPFMLCFMLSGDPLLTSIADKIAMQDSEIKTINGGYYWIDTAPGEVGRRFRDFRTRLQIYFARHLVRRFRADNKEFFKMHMQEGQYRSFYDIPCELFRNPPQQLTVSDDFYLVDIIVLGHNICKFDELLLATELVEDRSVFPNACYCTRTFMPRVGRLLFNDIHFGIPNPLFVKKDPSRLERWRRGVTSMADAYSLTVRFMVRDTLQLTSGAKLAKAAGAYALELCKGECPYEAVNEFVSRGCFESDTDGFPVERYWESQQIMVEQKELWATTHPGQRYDIVLACLEYCMQDVLVTKKLAHTLYDSYDQYYREQLGMDGHYNIFERPTIPSNTHAFWKQLAFTNYVNKQPAKRLKKLSPDFVAEVYSPHKTMFSYIRQALRGGRCYPTILGPYNKPVYVFDICGMYASALTHPMPHGMPLDPHHVSQYVDELNNILAEERDISYFDKRIKPSILKIDAYPPPIYNLDPLPPICSRRGGRLVWTNEPMYDEVITIIDIITMRNRGWKVVVTQDPMNIVWPEWETLCSEYVTININAKEKADREKNEVMRSISKMLSNALYGAFATNMDTTKILFERDLSDSDKNEIYEGTKVVKHITLLNDRSFSGKDFKPLEVVSADDDSNSPWSIHFNRDSEDEDDETLTKQNLSLEEVDWELKESVGRAPFIDDGEGQEEGHAHYARANETVMKPMRLLDATPESLTVLHLENLDKLVDNRRYATQIACFVLGWSRAFFCEWTEILHAPDRGVHPHDREPQSLYGDTDSLFVTESGYRRMVTRGAHRIKSQATRLTYDPQNPALYWACDCDIKCKRCGADTYSSESIFLAPKLYGLKDAVCTNKECGYVGAGKIRSKGHKQAELIYDTLMRSWLKYEDELYGAQSRIPELHTRRTIFKTTLLNKVSRYDPFTIHNEQLVRILRPWKDLTLYQHGDYLYPYNCAHPNPRTATDLRAVQDFGDEDPLAPIKLIDTPIALTVEECDELLDFLRD